MYTALIVEDELLVRIGIKVSIENSALPVEVVGDVADGQEAYEFMLKHRPDILVTDLRLPGMDGLQLIQKLRERGCDAKMMIISCLEDFETLRAAMNYQISHYLLKATMTGEELTDALSQVVRELKSDAPKVANNPQTTKKPCAQAAPRSAGLFWVPRTEDNPLLATTTIEILKEKLPGEPVMRRMDQCILVTLEEPLGDAVKGAVRAFLHYMQGAPGITAYCAWSNLHEETLEEAVVRLEALLNNLIYFAVKQWVFERPQPYTFSRLIEKMDALEAREQLEARFKGERFLDYQNARSALESAAVEGKDAFLSMMPPLLAACGQGDGAIEEIAAAPDADTALDILYRLLGHGLDTKCRAEIAKVIHYMRTHLDESMSLSAIAARASLSANYFSNLFTQEMGVSFVTYLNQLRLEKSQELLRKGDMPIQEVAWQCGFPNASYFNRIFRRKIGMSPGRWRNSKNVKERLG